MIILKKKALILTAALLTTFSTNSAFSQNCIVQDFSTDFNVMRNAAPPTSDSEVSYKFFPGNSFVSNPNNKNRFLISNSTAKKYMLLWVNRCQNTPNGNCGHRTKGNVPVIEVDGVDRRFFFTSHNKADACTRAQLYDLMGATQSATNVLNNYNVVKVDERTNPDYSSLIEPGFGFIDKCFLFDSTGLKDKLDGVVFDYEVQDNRTPNRTLSLSTYFKNFLKRADINKELVLWTNSLISPSAPLNGIDETINGRALFDLYDRVSILIYEKYSANQIEQTMIDQRQVYNVDPNKQNELDKIYVISGIGKMSMEQIEKTREGVTNHNYGGVAIWNNGISSSEITNCQHVYYEKVNCLIYDICP